MCARLSLRTSASLRVSSPERIPCPIRWCCDWISDLISAQAKVAVKVTRIQKIAANTFFLIVFLQLKIVQTMDAPAWSCPYSIPMPNSFVVLLLSFAAARLHTLSMIWSWNKMVLTGYPYFLVIQKKQASYNALMYSGFSAVSPIRALSIRPRTASLSRGSFALIGR